MNQRTERYTEGKSIQLVTKNVIRLLSSF